MTSIEILQHFQVCGGKTWALEKMASLLPDGTEPALLLEDFLEEDFLEEVSLREDFLEDDCLEDKALPDGTEPALLPED